MYMLRNTHEMEVTVEFILSGLDKTLSTLPGGIMSLNNNMKVTV